MSGAGKQSQKNEENFSKVKEKMQRLFGFGKPSTPPAIPKATTREVVFTTEILKEIGPESPANNRLRRIRELCEVVKLTRLEDNAVEALWGQISDLLQPQVVEENRHLALRFLHCLVEGQLPYLTIVRGHFFRVIQGLTDPADIQYRLQLFDTLSECGKNLLYFEDETGVFLQLWMPEVMSAGYVASFLPIILNVIKYNAAYVDEDVMAGLVQQTCMIPNRSRCDDELKKCLQVLDAVICYSYLPSNCLHHFVAALCHTVDKALFSEKSWELMRKLLGTYLGHSAIFTMCCMLQDKRKPVDILLLRGAIFFTGMALWGSRRVSTLKQSHSSVLPSFYEALSHENNIVAYEVVLNLQRLVSKYGKDLQHVTWEIVLDILQRLLTQIDKCGFERKVMTETHQVITSIENLYRNRQFFGPTARFFRLVEMCASKRPSSSVCALMDYQTQFIHPGQENWIEALNQLMERYLKGQTRTEVRKKSLEVLSLVLSINTHVYERELIEHIVLPHFSHCDTDPDPEVRCQSVDLLLGLCEDCHSNEFFELSIIVEKIVKKPLVSSFADSERKEEGILGPEEASLIDVRMAILKIIEVFKVKLYTAPASHCQRLYELLISHLEMQYSHLYLGRLACQLRKAIFNLLLLLRADSRSRVGLADRKPGERHVYSPYVMCRPSEDMESLLLKSPSVPGLSPSQIYSVIEYEHTFKLFLRCLETERDWTVLHTVLEKLTLVLENKTMVLSASSDNELLDALCGKLCAMVKDRTVEQSKKLINRPPNFTRSDFHACVFPVLASMVTYHAYLDKTRQRELVNCLEFGLVSKCAKICVTTLRICSLEMKELMMRMLPAVLLSLSKISATISMAIPVLAFLSSIVRIPKLYANFVEDQYMSVFAIALPYTNPFKFSHYTVSLAHHVIGIWFIRCRLPFRQGFVKYIQRGLKYNVLQLFEENSIRHLSAHNQDSSDRGRTSSLNEGHRIRRRNISGIEGVRNDGRIPMDEKMSQFHKELTETCVDMMARYAYGNFTALPKRSPMAQFLLKDGQRGMWVVGNKIITITTSGGGAKTNNSGLCDKCLSSYLNTQDPRKEVKRSAPIAMGSSAGESRRRHKSMAALGRSQTQVDSLGISLECEEPRRSRDDMSLPQEASTDIFGRDDAAVQTGSSLTTSANSDAMDAGFSGPKGRMSEQRTFSLSQCSCWCTSWAEVNIRGASGVVCWMMRIENESSSPSFSSDPSAPDITQLLAPVRCKTPDSDSLGKIDSGSLCEEEYETLHSQHFSEAERRLFHEEPLSQTDTPTQDVSDSIQTDSDLQFQSPSNLRRISSSPSVLSGSQDTCQSPRELLRELVECTERERQAETATRVESLGSRARPEAQDFSHTDTTFPHSGIRERGSSGATADPDVLGTRNDPQQGNSSDGNAQSSSVICKSRRSGEKSSDLARQLSLEEESPTDVARLTKMTSQKSAESSDSVFHVNPALTGTSFPAGRVGHLASTSSDGKAMVHRSTSTGKSFEPKKSVQRTMSEDLAGKKRPEALNLLSSHTKVFDRAAVEDSPNESSTPSSLQDEVPELRQLKRRGHTISVMSPAGQVRHSDDYDGRLQSGGPKDAKGGLSPSYVFLQLYQCHPMVQNQEVPLRVPDNDKFRRTIDMLDHIYPYETHKIGVLYMGKGQPSDERTLLGNEFGSPRYTEFLQGLGQMISIEEAERDKIYLGGLNPSDGKFTVTWQDESLRVIFHIATLMPTMPGDTRFNNKKSHIGNDFVTIVYNDSSEDYKSGTISGQFNFVSIVIRPLDYESNAVSLITKEDIADILGHTHTKIISDANLPLLVRQIAVHCNLASMVLQRQQSTLGTPEVFASNWLERLRQIKLLKRRIIEYQPEEAGGEPTSPSHVWPPPGASGDTGSGGCEDFTDYL